MEARAFAFSDLTASDVRRGNKAPPMPQKAAPKKKAASKQSWKAVTPDTETEGREDRAFN